MSRSSFDESLLAKVQALPEVDAAVGGVGGEAQLIDDDGDVIQFGGAPNIGFSVDPPASTRSCSRKEPGPTQRRRRGYVDCVAKDIEVGEFIGVQAEGPTQQLEVSGLFDFSAEGNIGGRRWPRST